MRVGLSSIVGDGFGTGSFQVSVISGAVVYPPFGTVISTNYGYEYPIAQGGAYFTYNSTNYPTQTVTVDIIADGAGGSILNWSNVRDLAWKSYGTVFSATSGVYTININGNDYQSGTFTADVAHDGSGGYTNINIVNSFTSSGVFIAYVPNAHRAGSIEVPSGSSMYYNNGVIDGYDYFHDGSGGSYNMDAGGFTPDATGYFYANGSNLTTEVPSMSGNFYNNGLYNTYVADGSGGYTTGTGGSYVTIGTIIFDSISYTGVGSNQEVPSGSGNYYYDQWSGDRYVWDGAGGYYQYSGQFYYPYGTYIYNDGTYNWYWDGSGGFYSI
jgi:hypothetical protein